MKEIKLKFWNREKKKMSRPYTLADLAYEGFPSQYTNEYDDLLDDECEVLQFTGLTNNGQEWCEGDILENDRDWYQISWSIDEARWEAVGIRATSETLALSELLSSETWVQGNIYQNPELLSS